MDDEIRRSWTDDGEGLGSRETESVVDAISRLISTEIEQPHLLICEDTVTGSTSYLGPFRDGFAALLAADEQERQDALHAPGDVFAYAVAPLYRP